jgi:hypothetical protein
VQPKSRAGWSSVEAASNRPATAASNTSDTAAMLAVTLLMVGATPWSSESRTDVIVDKSIRDLQARTCSTMLHCWHVANDPTVEAPNT